jgi:hypothetical protein
MLYGARALSRQEVPARYHRPMCYSAQIWADYRLYVRNYGAEHWAAVKMPKEPTTPAATACRGSTTT